MNKKDVLAKIEDFIVAHISGISCFVAIISTIVYASGCLKNIRSTIPNVITFSSIFLAVISLIYTLVISLKGSSLFQRMKDDFPEVQGEIYLLLYKMIVSSVMVVLISIAITVIPFSIHIIIKVIIALIGFFVFWYMLIGTIYMLKFMTDMAIKEEKPDDDESIT